jgi:hypothetical protein
MMIEQVLWLLIEARKVEVGLDILFKKTNDSEELKLSKIS